MSGLSTFSIETNDVVLLTFLGGRKVRASRKDLPRLLSGDDLTLVQDAYRRRHKFVTQSLPPWARVVIGAILVLSFGASGIKAYSVIIHTIHHPVSAPVSKPVVKQAGDFANQVAPASTVAPTSTIPASSSASATTLPTPVATTQPQVPQTTASVTLTTPVAPINVALPAPAQLLAPVQHIAQPLLQPITTTRGI